MSLTVKKVSSLESLLCLRLSGSVVAASPSSSWEGLTDRDQPAKGTGGNCGAFVCGAYLAFGILHLRHANISSCDLAESRFLTGCRHKTISKMSHCCIWNNKNDLFFGEGEEMFLHYT